MKTNFHIVSARAFFRPRLVRAFALGALLIATCIRAADAFENKPAVAALGWLAGEWSFEKNGRSVTERWSPPAGGIMLGTSHTVAKGKTVEYEFVVIRTEENGDVFYVAKPSGQAEAAFKLVRVSEREAVFENPQHDFPQRISYALKDGDTLIAAIEGTKDGRTRRVEFPYRRAK